MAPRARHVTTARRAVAGVVVASALACAWAPRAGAQSTPTDDIAPDPAPAAAATPAAADDATPTPRPRPRRTPRPPADDPVPAPAAAADAPESTDAPDPEAFTFAGDLKKRLVEIDPAATVEWTGRLLSVKANGQTFALYPKGRSGKTVVVNGVAETAAAPLMTTRESVYVPRSMVDFIVGRARAPKPEPAADPAPAATPEPTPADTAAGAVATPAAPAATVTPAPAPTPTPTPAPAASPRPTPATAPSPAATPADPLTAPRATPPPDPTPDPVATPPPTPTPTPRPTPRGTISVQVDVTPASGPGARRTPRPGRAGAGAAPTPRPATLRPDAPDPLRAAREERAALARAGGPARTLAELEKLAAADRLRRVVLDADDSPLLAGTPRGKAAAARALDLCRRAKPMLEAKGIEVVMTRDADARVAPGRRLSLIATSGAQALVTVTVSDSEFTDIAGFRLFYPDESVDQTPKSATQPATPADPAAAASATVAPALVYRPFQSGGKLLANAIAAAMKRATPREAAPPAPAALHLARRAPMASVVLVAGYLGNADDARRLADPARMDQAAAALAEAVGQYGDSLKTGGVRRP